MTAALSDLHPPSGEWTTDDLDELPEDGHRYELIDGALIVSPSPTSRHQKLVVRLDTALEVSCPPEWVVFQGVEVRISRLRSLTPDVLVVTAEAAAREPSKFKPHEVLLAVEIVSPGSVTMDRVAKPALYAQAGIPYYWRVETEGGIVAYTHRIKPEAQVYALTGRFDRTIDIDEPWVIQVPISQITPPYYRPDA
ncbi:MAG: Uma2 family endonuclease [Micromonosporaceae bacterium]|nr:Uma2 family endonuclease [Micromonosporaceae bacterium]